MTSNLLFRSFFCSRKLMVAFFLFLAKSIMFIGVVVRGCYYCCVLVWFLEFTNISRKCCVHIFSWNDVCFDTLFLLLCYAHIFFCIFFRSYSGLVYDFCLKAISVLGTLISYFAITNVFFNVFVVDYNKVNISTFLFFFLFCEEFTLVCPKLHSFKRYFVVFFGCI